MIMLKWMSSLVCPRTKQKLKLENGELVTADGANHYSFKNAIASFISPNERVAWENYQTETYSVDPLPANSYYKQFVGAWRTMLDLGCGDGVWSASLAGDVEHIYCVNPDHAALQILQKREIHNMYPVNAYGEQLPFTDDFFDGAFNIFVIEHLQNPAAMLEEIRRVLKPSGNLVIATDTAFFYKYLRVLIEWHRKGWKRWKPNDPTHINMMAPRHLRSYLRAAGFDIFDERILFLRGKWRRYFGWLPLSVWESCLSTMSIFVCRPIK